ncbi:MAG: hypothetical protein ACXACX_14620 [Candidatus Hodarchaeales archaeon]|jgi:hypothetical protein
MSVSELEDKAEKERISNFEKDRILDLFDRVEELENQLAELKKK